MAAANAVGKSKGPIINPGKCRCCRAIKKCRVLTAEYEWMGQKEVYSDMFMDCFGLLLSHLDGDSAECGVCATCVVRLRDACAFRRQVLETEQVFLNTVIYVKEETEKNLTVDVKSETAGEADALRDDREDLHTTNDVSEEITKPEKKLTVEVKLEPAGDDALMDDRDDVHSTDDDSEETTKPDPKCKIRKSQSNKRERRPRKAESKKSVVKKEIISKMKKIQAKLDAMIDKPVPQTKELRLLKKQNAEEMTHNTKLFQNALTIIQNSYVCPFLNSASIFYCYYCKDQFINTEELRSHTLNHNPKDFNDMMGYSKLPNIDITRIDCRLCTEIIEDIATFKKHITNIHGRLIYPVSNELLPFKLTMDNIKCIECNEVFPYFDLLVKHMTQHFGTHICEQCGACFLKLTSLLSHIKTHSRVETNFPCEICGKNLKSKYSMYLHVATVHEKKPTVNCYKCDESFLSSAIRNKHLIEVHGDKRTFSCKLCDKVYNRRKTLVEHNRRIHLKVFRHQCDLCDQRFYLPSQLKDHMATHTGERSYSFTNKRVSTTQKPKGRRAMIPCHSKTHLP